MSIACSIGIIGSVSLQTIKAVGRSDIVLKLEFIKKPVYVFLLIVGAVISPFAIAITMLLYNVFSSLVNAYQLSRVIKYSVKEQIKDLGTVLIMCFIMSVLVYPISFLRINYLVMMCLQILVGAISYWGISLVSNNESYYAIRYLIREKFNVNK